MTNTDSGPVPLHAGTRETRLGVMAEPEDSHRDFLPRFIDAQRAFNDGDPEPNLGLLSRENPVTLFAARGLVDSGTKPVTLDSFGAVPTAGFAAR